ncbi:MAG TPA: glutamate 5-kinase [Rhodospirillaceae bacterium]|nr:glutamate 5-kinase [Rhodospirillaceae bacterium]
MSATEAIANGKRIVIKVGSALLTDKARGELNQAWVDDFSAKICAFLKDHKEIIIVSSGAVALGRKEMGISSDIPPGKIPLPLKQAASAVGQPHVFNGYALAFAKHGVGVAQVLLTMGETENRRTHLNARATLQELVSKGIVPIINENDTILTEELRFGDNDRLAARVAQMIEADTVILLTTTSGLYTADPGTDPKAEHIPVVETVTEEHIKMAGDALPGLSTGGMRSKIEAAQAATRAGISLVIAGSFDGKCTLFKAMEHAPNSRKRWIATHMHPKGVLVIDAGALKALKEGKSLLPIGVKKIEGDFERGDAVTIKTADGKIVGIGLSAYASEDALKIIGKKTAEIHEILGFSGRDALVHRNDMALQT